MEAHTEEAKRNNKINVAIIVALLLVAGISIYFLINENTTNKTLTADKTKLEQQYKSITDTLDDKEQQLEAMKGKNAELDKAIEAKQEEIAQQKKEISYLFAKGKMTTAALAKAQGKITEYESSIADLQKKLDDLSQQNQALASQNQQLNTDLTSERTTTSQQKDQIAGLSKKVEVGSLLQPKNMQVEAVKTKGNGKEVAVKKAKAAQALKISFETGENKVVDPGPLNLYVRVIDPKGATVAVADQGAGTITDVATQQPVQYTKEADIQYDQKDKKVAVYVKQPAIEKGTYKVEVYQNGYVIGKDEVALK